MRKALPIVLVAGVIVACGIPDLKPFSDATTQMSTVLKQGFEKTRASMTGAVTTAGDPDEFAKQLKLLDDRWKPTRKALSSLVAYSDSLAAVAEAGKKGQATMEKVTTALSDLANSVAGLTIPATGAKIVQAVGAKIIEMQAAKDIRKAVDKANEAVDIIAPVLKQNFEDLRNIHNAASSAWEARTEGQSSFQRNYYDALVGEQHRLEYLLTLIIDYQSAPARLRWRAALARGKGDEAQAKKFEAAIPQEQEDNLKALKAADSAFESMDLKGKDVPAKVEARQQHLLELINAQRKEISLLDASYQQATGELNGIRDARAEGDRLLAKGGEAIDAWQKAHHSLKATVDGQQTRPSLADLWSIIGELQALLK
jgi:hypothetical protein